MLCTVCQQHAFQEAAWVPHFETRHHRVRAPTLSSTTTFASGNSTINFKTGSDVSRNEEFVGIFDPRRIRTNPRRIRTMNQMEPTGGNNDNAVWDKAAASALDVHELLHADISAKAGLQDHHHSQSQQCPELQQGHW